MAMPKVQLSPDPLIAPPAQSAETENTLHVPRIILAGEANSGKSTLVNVLLQTQLLATDIVSTTPCPLLLRFGETAHLRILRNDGTAAIRSLGDLRDLTRAQARFVEVHLPSAVLRKMEILDLPGFTSRADAEAYSQWVSAAEVLIWCTAATQAWKASEEAMWLSLGRARTGSFLVLTHRDLLSDEQLEDVTARISRETQRYFSRWTAIAAPQAVAARHPRGAGTGLADFTEKLERLLEAPPRQPRVEPAPQPPRSTRSELPHPLPAFAQLRERVLTAVGSAQPGEQAAGIIAREFEAYDKQTLKPWLAAHRAIAGSKSIEGLLPADEAEVGTYLDPQHGDDFVFTAAQILRQIEAELTEALHNHMGTEAATNL
jgi:hypothetical protein